MEDIFSSAFNLNFHSLNLEEEYNKTIEKKVKVYIRMITLIIFLASLGPTIEISFFFEYYFKNNFKVVMFTSYFISLITINFLFLVLLNNKIVIKIVNYVNYFILLFIFTNLRYPLINFLKVDTIIFYVFTTTEIVLRLILALLGIYNFLEFSILNVLTICSTWLIYAPVAPNNTFTTNMLLLMAYSIAIIVVIIFSYFLEKYNKRAFYFYYLNKQKTEWLENVLENMKTGFVSIKGNKFSYINESSENMIDLLNEKKENFDLNDPKSSESKYKIIFLYLDKIIVKNSCKEKLISSDKQSPYLFKDANKFLFKLLSEINIDAISKIYKYLNIFFTFRRSNCSYHYEILKRRNLSTFRFTNRRNFPFF
jgi:hypothetical protein